eukprot:6656028-Prymnesium_polylepis.1
MADKDALMPSSARPEVESPHRAETSIPDEGSEPHHRAVRPVSGRADPTGTTQPYLRLSRASAIFSRGRWRTRHVILSSGGGCGKRIGSGQHQPKGFTACKCNPGDAHGGDGSSVGVQAAASGSVVLRRRLYEC